jgi:hypothetical protein
MNFEKDHAPPGIYLMVPAPSLRALHHVSGACLSLDTLGGFE